MIQLYRTRQGVVATRDGQLYFFDTYDWDWLISRDDLKDTIEKEISQTEPVTNMTIADFSLLSPVLSQEVWACGVTYYRSRDARMEESRDSGGGDFYDRVYDAERPEIFPKATPHRVVGPGGSVRMRRDSAWNVPEPELTLVVSTNGVINGYTIGNDMSSRDIEGENPLYLPQAKIYDGSCALGPCIAISREPLPADTAISMNITRHDNTVFEGSTTLAEMKRQPRELVDFLFRECSFPLGCFLLTGTGIIPPGSFTLQPGDEVSITIDHVGTLVNTVEQSEASEEM